MALVAPAMALGMRYLPGPDLGPPYLLFCPPILVAATLGGPWSGILSTALSAVFAAAWVLSAGHGTPLVSPRDAVSLVAFVVSGLLVSLLAHLHRKAQERAAAAERSAALRETRARLEDSEERLRRIRRDAHMNAAQLAAVIQAVQDGISLADRSGRFVLVNPALSRLHGFVSVEDEWADVSAAFADLELCELDGRVLPREGWPTARALRGESFVEWELRARRRDTGREAILSYSGAPIRGDDGAVELALLVTRDITEHKQAALRLDAERQRLAITLQSIGDAVIGTDVSTRITDFNTIAERLTGWSAADAVGRPLSEVFRIVDEDTGASIEDPAARVLHDGVVVGLANPTALVARDGTRRPIADSAAPIRTNAGAVSGVVLVFRDQSEEKASREALRRSEERFRALIEKSTDMIQVLDAGGRITFWSPSTTEAMGWREDEAVGRHVLEWIHPEDCERTASRFASLLARSGAREVMLVRQRHADGSWRHVELKARNLLDDPAVQGVVVNARDVSERLALEHQLRQAQKLESVGRLAGGVAHDFNNLLTVILAGVAELQRAPDDRSAVEDIAEEIGIAGERARELTQQLLAFARKQVIAPITLNVSAVVQGTERLLRRLLGEDVVLTTQLVRDPWPVRCDRGQVEQIIVNLALNARDAMPAGGRLSLETANVELTDAARTGPRPGRWVRLIVSDDGEGMAPEVRERIFEPFFTTKEVGKGTGLGLSTVYGIVTQNDGFIRVDSEPGRGTSFEIFLPQAAPGAPEAATPQEHAPRSGTETVLVVEDDAQVRAVTVRALRSAGYQVLVAGSGEEALALSAREPGRIHLLLTDVVMPGMGGRAVAERLGAARDNVRVLYVSGYAQDVFGKDGGVEAGVELLPKPFTPAALLERVRTVLDAPVPARRVTDP